MSVTSAELLRDYSVEITGKDATAVVEGGHLLPTGTRINVTYLANEDTGLRLKAARTVREEGFVPVPHIAARRLTSKTELADFLSGLEADGASRHVFVVAGDPHESKGPFPDALSLLDSDLLARYGVDRVSISGYPEGHPFIPDAALWPALERKASRLNELGQEGEIITQFGFDVDPVLAWIKQLRDRGIHLPVRIGVAGPAGVKRLLSYARRFGVASSAGVARKYGLSMSNLVGTAGPDRFMTEFADRLEPLEHGTVKVHFYTFGGLRTTAEWVHTFTAEEPTAKGRT